MIGFDTETKPTFRAGEKNLNPICLVQLATPEIAVLFRLVRHQPLPSPLRELLSDPTLTLVGQEIGREIAQLHESDVRAGGLGCTPPPLTATPAVSADAPVKAIDFGLAVFFDPAALPLTHLGLEGTPWYMAPEVLSSAAEPASDVFSAGVMAYQLLSGRLPFDDRDGGDAPALSKVWKAILTEAPRFGSGWADVSEQAVDFCRRLLDKCVRCCWFF